AATAVAPVATVAACARASARCSTAARARHGSAVTDRTDTPIPAAGTACTAARRATVRRRAAARASVRRGRRLLTTSSEHHVHETQRADLHEAHELSSSASSRETTTLVCPPISLNPRMSERESLAWRPRYSRIDRRHFDAGPVPLGEASTDHV